MTAPFQLIPIAGIQDLNSRRGKQVLQDALDQLAGMFARAGIGRRHLDADILADIDTTFSLDDLDDVTLVDLSAGSLLYWNGTSWTNLFLGAAGRRLAVNSGGNGLEWVNPNHNLLDGSEHPDTVSGAAARGAVIVGNATPRWDRLLVGANRTFLRSDGTDTSFAAIQGDDLPTLIAQIAGLSTTGAGGLVLKRNAGNTGFEFGAAGSSSPTTTRGDLIRRGASADERLAHPGSNGRVLISGATDPDWTNVEGLPDFIGNTRGMILYRGPTYWQALAIGTEDQVLTAVDDGSGNMIPGWADLSDITSFGSIATSTAGGISRTVPAKDTGDALRVWFAIDTTGNITLTLDGVSLIPGFSGSFAGPGIFEAVIVVESSTQALCTWKAVDDVGGNQAGVDTITGLDWTVAQDLNATVSAGDMRVLGVEDAFGSATAGGGSGGGGAGPWIAYTPGLNVSNCTATGEYRENGGSIDLRIALAFTGAPSPDTGIQVGLPTGFAVSGSIVAPLDLSVEGVCCLYDVSATNPIRFFGGVTAVLPVANTLYLLMEENNRPLQPTFPLTIANGDYLWVRANGIPGSF